MILTLLESPGNMREAMEFTIAVLPGDGIGPEVIDEGTKLLRTVGEVFGHRFRCEYSHIGGAAIDRQGAPIADETVTMCKASHAILLGAVGGPRWDDPEAKTRPEDGLLRLRHDLKLFANIRPVKTSAPLTESSPLKPEIVRDVDLVVVRELTGGLYFGRPKKRWETSRGRRAVDTMAYSETEVERILRVGFELAKRRRGRLVSVDKANVLETSRLWREIATELAPEYPEVGLRHMLVDACAMALLRNPRDFDVIVTENTFGDILSDETAVLAGSIGMLPSASLGGKGLARGWGKGRARSFGLYEPIHGSAPDIAGQNKANPLATILSVALMLRLSLGLPQEANAVETAVQQVLASGHRTLDITTSRNTVVGTREMGNLVAAKLKDTAGAGL